MCDEHLPLHHRRRRPHRLGSRRPSHSEGPVTLRKRLAHEAKPVEGEIVTRSLSFYRGCALGALSGAIGSLSAPASWQTFATIGLLTAFVEFIHWDARRQRRKIGLHDLRQDD